MRIENSDINDLLQTLLALIALLPLLDTWRRRLFPPKPQAYVMHCESGQFVLRGGDVTFALTGVSAVREAGYVTPINEGF